MIDQKGSALDVQAVGAAEPRLPPVRDTRSRKGDLCAKFDGEWKPCRYLQKVVYMTAAGGLVEDEDIRRFIELYDHCIKHGRLGYGQLAPMCMIPLAPLASGPQRALLVVYAFSDYIIDELNAWLGGSFFVSEGGQIEDVPWPELSE